VKGGEPYLGLISLFPLQNHRSPGTSPLGLTSLKRKNLPIVVTLGGIGSCYASLALNLIAFFLATNCAITGSTRHFFAPAHSFVSEITVPLRRFIM
jgi:hypothetical protein